nr:reverse transcriptase domain-containing protein [Tanacetum cinerariifolium]
EKEADDAAETLRKTFAKSTEDLLLQAGAARYSSIKQERLNTDSTPINTASTPVNTTSPSRNVNTVGPSYLDLLNYANQGDSHISSLEDIYEVPNDGIFTSTSYDDEGAVADFTNLESTVNIEPKKIFQALEDESWVDVIQEELLQFKTQQNKQFFGHDKEDLHAHVRYFNKITSTLKFPNVLNTSTKLMLFPFSLKDQDSLNSAAGGNFLDKMPRECLAIIESKSKVRYSHNKPVVAKVSTNTSTSGISPNIVELKDMVKALLLDKKKSKPISCSRESSRGKLCNIWSASTSSSGTLPSNTIANPKSDLKAITTRSGVSYDGPQILPSTSFLPKVVEDEPEATKCTVNPTNNESTEDVLPQVVQSESTSELVTSPISEPVIALVTASKPNPKTSIPYPSRRNDERNHEKANNQIEKFYQIFKDMSF